MNNVGTTAKEDLGVLVTSVQGRDIRRDLVCKQVIIHLLFIILSYEREEYPSEL